MNRCWHMDSRQFHDGVNKTWGNLNKVNQMFSKKIRASKKVDINSPEASCKNERIYLRLFVCCLHKREQNIDLIILSLSSHFLVHFRSVHMITLGSVTC